MLAAGQGLKRLEAPSLEKGGPLKLFLRSGFRLTSKSVQRASILAEVSPWFRTYIFPAAVNGSRNKILES